MTRALLALLLIVGQFSVAAAPRRRAARHPSAFPAPEAIVTAARQAAEAAMAIGVPAVQIAVSHRGKVIYSHAFGTSDRESGTAATPRSVMQIGSITKQFTAAAILRLAERGALKLDDRIEKFVPEFDARGRTITLRHLLTHTSGLARTWYNPDDWYKPTGPPVPTLSSPVTRELVIANINAQPFEFTPGSKWSYSNAGFMLLGYAIESITGMQYAEYVHHEFALPLGLLDTGVCGTSNLPMTEGYGVFSAEKLLRLPALHASTSTSSGSLCSTASDLARWTHLLATGSVMLPASFAKMTTPVSPIVPYGFGLDLKNMAGQQAVSHGGAIDGYLSYLLYFPQQEIGVAVLTNAFPVPTDHTPIIAVAVGSAALGSL
jgi:D-alanyl-D-alanine carboxypeptidase